VILMCYFGFFFNVGVGMLMAMEWFQWYSILLTMLPAIRLSVAIFGRGGEFGRGSFWLFMGDLMLIDQGVRLEFFSGVSARRLLAMGLLLSLVGRRWCRLPMYRSLHYRYYLLELMGACRRVSRRYNFYGHRVTF
jgi:hypothetical protein